MNLSLRSAGLGALALALLSTSALAAEVNIYSARHYDADEKLYAAFTEATGITVNRIEGKGDELLARIAAEGTLSPADVFITVDAGNLWKAEQDGLFQTVDSQVLAERIPEALRSPTGAWFGFATRARVIVYNRAEIDPATVPTYASLTGAALKGRVCSRTSSNIYNLSLLAGMIEHDGVENAEAWAKGVAANFARDPEGNDTAQITATAAGTCGVAIANHYYVVRLAASGDEADREAAAKVGVVFPDQDGRGTHVNISGAGVVKSAPNRDAAVKFLEFLASDTAQQFFAAANNEYPAVPGVATDNATLDALGTFKADPINVAAYGENQAEAQKAFDRAGWK